MFFKNGETVLRSGVYRCLGCGATRNFAVGDIFRDCEVCFAGSAAGPVGYLEEDEIWKYVG